MIKHTGHIIILFLIFFFITNPIAASLKAPKLRLTLSECVEMALRNNEEIKAAGYDIQSYIAQKIEATKRYVPVIKTKYRIAPVPKDLNNPAESFLAGDISIFNSIRFEAGIPITTFGRLTINKHLADIGIDAARLKQKKKADEIVVDIYKLYHGILLARELKQLANKALGTIKESLTSCEKKDPPDQLQILKLKAIYYEVERRLDEGITKETIALAMLKVRIGIEDDTNFNLKDTYLKRDHFKDKTYKALLHVSKDKRPEFKLLRHQVNAKQLQIALEKRNYMPMVKLGGYFEYGNSPGIIGDEDDNAFNNPFNFTRAAFGIEVSNELDFRKIKANVEKAKAEHLKSIAEKRSNFRLLEIDLKNAYLEYKQRKKLLYRAEKEKRSARQVVFLTKSNLDIGLGERKDYLDALQSYLLIQATYFENVYKYNIAIATLKQKLGIITKEYPASKQN